MTESPLSAASEPENGQKRPFWLEATASDLEGLEFEGPLVGCTSADPDALSAAYRKAANLHKELGDEAAAPAARVFAMLAAVTGMHFRPEEPNEPFGAMCRWPDGRRSPILEDFLGSPLELLASAAARAQNPVLKAWLSDVSWLLDRRRRDLGGAAVTAYVDTVEALESVELKDQLDEGHGALGLLGRDYLRRALQIGRQTGWDNPDVQKACSWVIELRKRAISISAWTMLCWFADLELDFDASPARELASELERALMTGSSEPTASRDVDVWRIAARAYHDARDKDGETRSRTAAAECLVTQAEIFDQRGSAMIAAHWLSAAIAEYHGVAGKKDRRRELRHKLIDIQSGIVDEMSSFSHPIDIRQIVDAVEKQFKGLNLLDSLLLFADMCQSPDPAELRREALESIRDHPLSSLFGASFHDASGKVIHRSSGGRIGDDHDASVATTIAQHESQRRLIHAKSGIDVARRHIIEQHYLTTDMLAHLFEHSPFVPEHLLQTFSLGFKRFFQGDHISALYILTPLLENSLRYVLKMSGHDVTTFDDARQTQEDRSITSLFDGMRVEMDEVFGPAITTDIENVFLAKAGPSLRHRVAHGLLHDGAPYGADAVYACWLIFRLSCLPLFGHRDELSLH